MIVLRGILVVLLIGFSLPALAKARVLDFSSKVEIKNDGSLEITEKFVISLDQPGPLPIDRTFLDLLPPKAGDPFFFRRKTNITFFEMTLNGAPVPFTKSLKDWVNSPLSGTPYFFTVDNLEIIYPPGEYTFFAHYQMDGQVYPFPGGQGVSFKVSDFADQFLIEKAIVDVIFPDGVKLLGQRATTGFALAPTKDYQKGVVSKKISRNHIRFETTQPIPPDPASPAFEEMLQISLGFPQGTFPIQSFAISLETYWEYLILYNTHRPTLLLHYFFLLIVALYFFIGWRKFQPGKPEQDSIVMGPPTHLSPAQMGSTEDPGFVIRAFAATLVNMALKKTTKISVDKNLNFTILKIREKPPPFYLKKRQYLKPCFHRE